MFNIGHKILVRNHMRDVQNPKYDVAARLVPMMGRHFEFMGESDKTHIVNGQDVKIMYLVNELIKCFT